MMTPGNPSPGVWSPESRVRARCHQEDPLSPRTCHGAVVRLGCTEAFPPVRSHWKAQLGNFWQAGLHGSDKPLPHRLVVLRFLPAVWELRGPGSHPSPSLEPGATVRVRASEASHGTEIQLWDPRPTFVGRSERKEEKKPPWTFVGGDEQTKAPVVFTKE